MKILASSGYAKSLLPASYVLQNLNGQLYGVPTGSLSGLRRAFFDVFSFLVKEIVGNASSLRSSLQSLKTEPRNLLTDRFCLMFSVEAD